MEYWSSGGLVLFWESTSSNCNLGVSLIVNMSSSNAVLISEGI